MDGKLSGVINFFEGIWNWVCERFEGAWEWVKAAMDFLYDIIMWTMMKIFRPMFDELNTTIANSINNIESMATDLFTRNSPSKADENSGRAAREFINAVFSAKFMVLFLTIISALEAAEIASKVMPIAWIIVGAITLLFITSTYKVISSMFDLVHPLPDEDRGVLQPAGTLLPEPENTWSDAIVDIVGFIAALGTEISKGSLKSIFDLSSATKLAFGSMLLTFISLVFLEGGNLAIAIGCELAAIALFAGSIGLLIKGGIKEATNAPFTFIAGLTATTWSLVQLMFGYQTINEHIRVYGFT